MTWLAKWTDHDTVHIIPMHDLIKHTEDAECMCGPAAELTMQDGKRDHRLHTHHSLDGREIR